MAGHVTVPLYPTLTPETIRQILEHSESRLVFVGKLDGFEAMKSGIPEGLPLVVMPLGPAIDAPRWDDIVAKTKPLEASPTRDPDDLATIVYTSGSTGMPKGVMHSFRTMCAGLCALEEYGITADDRMLSYLPLAHVYERLAVETPSIAAAFRVYFAESLDTFAADLRRARPTIFVSVPRLWSKFQQGVFAKVPPKRLALLLRIPIVRGFMQKKIQGGLGLADVRFAASGSAPIPAELLDWYRSLGLEVLEGYGMTENFAISARDAARRGARRLRRLGADGRGAQVPRHRRAPREEPGEHARLLQGRGAHARGARRRGLRPHGRPRRDRRQGPAEDHWARQGAVQDEQGQVRRARRPSRTLCFFTTTWSRRSCRVQPCRSPSGSSCSRTARAPARRPRPSVTSLTGSLEAHLERTNKALDPHEQLEKIVVTRDMWTIENGLLTPTMKVKRAAIEGRYVPRGEWYAERTTVIWE